MSVEAQRDTANVYMLSGGSVAAVDQVGPGTCEGPLPQGLGNWGIDSRVVQKVPFPHRTWPTCATPVCSSLDDRMTWKDLIPARAPLPSLSPLPPSK